MFKEIELSPGNKAQAINREIKGDEVLNKCLYIAEFLGAEIDKDEEIIKEIEIVEGAKTTVPFTDILSIYPLGFQLENSYQVIFDKMIEEFGEDVTIDLMDNLTEVITPYLNEADKIAEDAGLPDFDENLDMEKQKEILLENTSEDDRARMKTLIDDASFMFFYMVVEKLQELKDKK